MNEGRLPQWDLQVALTRYRELLSEAEAERLARRATREREPLFQLLRVQLGRGLITLGHRWAPELPADMPTISLCLRELDTAAGCEPCAKKMVDRALEQGSSERQIQKVLGIVTYMHRLDCLAGEIGPEALARMEKPLAMARRTLEEAGINGGAR